GLFRGRAANFLWINPCLTSEGCGLGRTLQDGQFGTEESAARKAQDNGQRDENAVKADVENDREAAIPVLNCLHVPTFPVSSRNPNRRMWRHLGEGPDWSASQGQKRSLVSPNAISDRISASPTAIATFITRSEGGRPRAHS